MYMYMQIQDTNFNSIYHYSFTLHSSNCSEQEERNAQADVPILVLQIGKVVSLEVGEDGSGGLGHGHPGQLQGPASLRGTGEHLPLSWGGGGGGGGVWSACTHPATGIIV